MILVYFLSIVKNSQGKPCDPVYKNHIERIASKIESWHNRLSLKKKGSFNEDRDFIEIGNSPSRFSSSSSD